MHNNLEAVKGAEALLKRIPRHGDLHSLIVSPAKQMEWTQLTSEK